MFETLAKLKAERNGPSQGRSKWRKSRLAISSMQNKNVISYDKQSCFPTMHSDLWMTE